jgi:hypothetical protein
MNQSRATDRRFALLEQESQSIQGQEQTAGREDNIAGNPQPANISIRLEWTTSGERAYHSPREMAATA